MNIRCKSRRGFTLVEVSLALLIVAVGMLGSLAVLPQGSKASRDGREDTAAAMVAQSALESLRGHVQKGLNPATWTYVPDGLFVSTAFKSTTAAPGGPDVYVYRDAAKKMPIGMARMLHTPIANGSFRLSLTFFRGDYAAYAANGAPALKAKSRIFSLVANPLVISP
ncbi:MAG: prepilin-type N-terminal cleavage/methylation domain-containing protein [Kiritimatiellia bacterium]